MNSEAWPTMMCMLSAQAKDTICENSKPQSSVHKLITHPEASQSILREGWKRTGYRIIETAMATDHMLSSWVSGLKSERFYSRRCDS